MSEKKADLPLTTKAAIFAGGSGLVLLTDATAHLGLPGLAIGGLGAYALAKESPQIWEEIKKAFPFLPDLPSSRSNAVLTWLFGSHRSSEQMEEVQEKYEPPAQEPMEEPRERTPRFSNTEDLRTPRNKKEVFLFSSVLQTFKPSLDHIYIGSLESGQPVFCRAEELCHVALAGATRGGKSSILRMLLAQLCASGAKVLVLNPHHSRYILDKKEDWTPFEPCLMYDPMECRKYDVIDFYLKQIATEILPKRLEKYAHSLPVGKPYFIALDELPAIVKHVPDASNYLEDILREGAKVGLFLITAAQDFLVKTIAPNGSGGAIRECYRTAYYVGGDATTAKILLDMPANQIDEDIMGRGTVMLRNWIHVKKSVVVRVPLVDNEALYRLLGPSTYEPVMEYDSEDITAYTASQGEREAPQTDDLPTLTRHRGHVSSYEVHQRNVAAQRAMRLDIATVRRNEPTTRPEQPVENTLSKEEQAVMAAYQAGHKTGNAITAYLENTISSTKANQILHKLARLEMIDWQPRKV